MGESKNFCLRQNGLVKHESHSHDNRKIEIGSLIDKSVSLKLNLHRLQRKDVCIKILTIIFPFAR